MSRALEKFAYNALQTLGVASVLWEQQTWALCVGAFTIGLGAYMRGRLDRNT